MRSLFPSPAWMFPVLSSLYMRCCNPLIIFAALSPVAPCLSYWGWQKGMGMLCGLCFFINIWSSLESIIFFKYMCSDLFFWKKKKKKFSSSLAIINIEETVSLFYPCRLFRYQNTLCLHSLILKLYEPGSFTSSLRDFSCQ